MTALIIVVAVVLTFEVCCLVDVARAKEVRRLDRQISQVLSEAIKEPMTKSPGLILPTSRPVSSTTPTYSCPIGVGPSMASSPR
jgi:hypothetical protein